MPPTPELVQQPAHDTEEEESIGPPQDPLFVSMLLCMVLTIVAFFFKPLVTGPSTSPPTISLSNQTAIDGATLLRVLTSVNSIMATNDTAYDPYISHCGLSVFEQSIRLQTMLVEDSPFVREKGAIISSLKSSLESIKPLDMKLLIRNHRYHQAVWASRKSKARTDKTLVGGIAIDWSRLLILTAFLNSASAPSHQNGFRSRSL